MNNDDYKNEKGVKLIDSIGRVSLYVNDNISGERNKSSIDGNTLIYPNVICVKKDDKDKIFFKGFPTIIELNDEEIISPTLCGSFDPKNCKIYEAIEGTLIKVFNVDNVWYTSTNRRLDAFKSKWAAKRESFGERFAKALRIIDRKIINTDYSDDEQFPGDHFDCITPDTKETIIDIEDDKEFLSSFYDRELKSEYKYTFMLKPSDEERIVCNSTTVEDDDVITKVATFDKDDNEINDDNTVKVRGISNRKLLLFETPKEISEYIFDNVDYHTSQGLICFNSDDRSIYKIISKEYQNLFNLRGNIPSLRFRYLMLRSESEEIRSKFFELYPNMFSIANELEKQIYKLCLDLHQTYISIYIDLKHNPNLSQEEYRAIKFIHEIYSETRTRTTASRINDILTYDASPSELNKLLRWKSREIRHKSMNTTNK